MANGGLFDFNGNGKLDASDYHIYSTFYKDSGNGSGGNGGGGGGCGCSSCLGTIMFIGIVMIFFSIFKG